MDCWPCTVFLMAILWTKYQNFATIGAIRKEVNCRSIFITMLLLKKKKKREHIYKFINMLTSIFHLPKHIFAYDLVKSRIFGFFIAIAGFAKECYDDILKWNKAIHKCYDLDVQRCILVFNSFFSFLYTIWNFNMNFKLFLWKK